MDHAITAPQPPCASSIGQVTISQDMRRPRSARRPRGRATLRAARGADSNIAELGRISWPAGPLTVTAADVADLECEKPATVLRSLLELCRHIGRRDILILNLRHLALDATSASVDTRRVGMLWEMVERTCDQMNFSAPSIALEETANGLDMRISLSACD